MLCKQDGQHQKNHPTNQKTDKTRPTTKHTRERRRRKKKKQVRGQSLGEGADVDVRAEVGVRSQVEETQGETQTRKWVWGSPAPEKEKTKNTSPTNIPTTRKKKQRTTNTEANVGQVLKGTRPKSMPSPERNTVQKNQPRSLKYPTKTQMQIPDNSQRTSHCRVAGPIGRPAISGETPRGTVVPRCPKTPPREPPPEAQKLTACRTKEDRNPRNIVAQRLAGSLISRKVTNKNRTRPTYIFADNILTDTQRFPYNPQTPSLCWSRCPGEPARRGLGQSSPTKLQWGCFLSSKNRKNNRNRLRRFVARKKSQGSLGGEALLRPKELLRFCHLHQKIAIAEKSRHLVHSGVRG